MLLKRQLDLTRKSQIVVDHEKQARFYIPRNEKYFFKCTITSIIDIIDKIRKNVLCFCLISMLFSE